MKNKGIMRDIMLVLIGVLLSSVTVYAVDYLYASSDVSYSNAASELEATNVQDALDELYSKFKGTGFVCPEGYVCAQAATCEAGKYLQAGAISCSNCPAGKYCEGGIYQLGKDIDQGITGNCIAGTYSTGGASTCTACPGSMTSNAGSTAKTQCKITCNAGKYLAKSGSSCSNCPAGKYCSSSGTYNYSDSADQGITGTCPAGTYSTGGATTSSCTACAAGTYRASTGGTSASSCTSCVKGSYSAAGASSCTACQPSGAAGANGTTSAAGATSCNASCGKSNVASWKTASWSANSVSNLCTINTCATNYTLSSNTCVVTPYWTVGSTQYSNAWYCNQDNGCKSYCSSSFGNSTYSCGQPSGLPSDVSNGSATTDNTCWCKSSVAYSTSGWSYLKSYSNNWYCYTNCRSDCVSAGKRNVFSCTTSSSTTPTNPSQSKGQYCWCNS